jgi:hypothetical protein
MTNQDPVLTENLSLSKADIKGIFNISESEYLRLRREIEQLLEKRHLFQIDLKSLSERTKLTEIVSEKAWLLFQKAKIHIDKQYLLLPKLQTALFTLILRTKRGMIRRQRRPGRISRKLLLYSLLVPTLIPFLLGAAAPDTISTACHTDNVASLPTFRVVHHASNSVALFRFQDIITPRDQLVVFNLRHGQFRLLQKLLADDLGYQPLLHGVFYLQDNNLMEIQHQRAFLAALQYSLNLKSEVIEFEIQEKDTIAQYKTKDLDSQLSIHKSKTCP